MQCKKLILIIFKNTVILFIFIMKMLCNVYLALRGSFSVTDIRDGICKAPIVISILQSASCHQHFVKCLLSSAFCKAPLVINASQSKSKEWNRIVSLEVVLAVIVSHFPEDAESIFLRNTGVCPPQYRMSPLRIL